jgi:hypothetical protein
MHHHLSLGLCLRQASVTGLRALTVHVVYSLFLSPLPVRLILVRLTARAPVFFTTTANATLIDIFPWHYYYKYETYSTIPCSSLNSALCTQLNVIQSVLLVILSRALKLSLYLSADRVLLSSYHYLRPLTVPHSASLSTSRPQMGYLFLKCSAQHLMLSLLRGKPNHTSVSIREMTENKY